MRVTRNSGIIARIEKMSIGILINFEKIFEAGDLDSIYIFFRFGKRKLWCRSGRTHSRTKIKSRTPKGVQLFMVGEGGFDLHFLLRGENRGVDAVEPASSDSPPDWQAICQGSFSPFSATWYKVSCRTEQRTPFPLTKSIRSGTLSLSKYSV